MTSKPAFSKATICSAALFCIVFLQKFGVPLGGDLQGPLLIPILCALLVYLLATGQAVLEIQDTMLFGGFVIAVVFVNLVGDASFSLPSVLLLLTLTSMFCFRIPIPEEDYFKILKFFQNCMLAITMIEFGQYLIQLAGRGMPTTTGHVPDWILLSGFVYIQPIYYGSVLMKPNGIFMLETSYLSQFLGLALAVEVAVFKRRWAIVLFLMAITLSLGGTGMILAAIAMGSIAFGQPRLVVRMSVGLVLAMIVGFSLGLFELISARLAEFSDPHTSAGVRFLLPYIRMYENMTDSTSRFLFGAGAGFLDRTRGFAWSSPSKVWVEEGFLCFVFYLPFILSTFFRYVYAPLLSIVLFSEYFFVTGGGLMQPCAVGAAVFLATGYIVATPGRSATYRPIKSNATHSLRQREGIQRGACS
jgi:hypothetical protein